MSDLRQAGPGAGDLWNEVVGQERAVRLLTEAAVDPVHAWLFLGPAGSGKRAAARAFAAELLSAGADPEAATRHRRLAAAEQHPDLLVFERVGAAISAEQADDIVRRASRSAVEGERKVLLLDEFHLVQPGVGPKLLKTIEEPPAGTFFLILAEEVPPELVTVASRAVRVDFVPLAEQTIADRLVAEGVAAATAAEAAAERPAATSTGPACSPPTTVSPSAWRCGVTSPGGSTAGGPPPRRWSTRSRATIDDAAEPLRQRHEAEIAELNERIERYGQRGAGARDLDARHRRESRRLRTDELRLGLANLARAYRDELAVSHDPHRSLDALAAIQATAEGLIRNPNEELMLVDLFLHLPSLA